MQHFGQSGWFPSIFGAFMKAAGDAGAAALYGHSLDLPDHEGDSVVVNGGGASASQTQKQKQKQKQKASGGGGGEKKEKPDKPHCDNGHGTDEDCQPPGDPKQND
jgi:hypothetical protein